MTVSEGLILSIEVLVLEKRSKQVAIVISLLRKYLVQSQNFRLAEYKLRFFICLCFFFISWINPVQEVCFGYLATSKSLQVSFSSLVEVDQIRFLVFDNAEDVGFPRPFGAMPQCLKWHSSSLVVFAMFVPSFNTNLTRSNLIVSVLFISFYSTRILVFV